MIRNNGSGTAASMAATCVLVFMLCATPAFAQTAADERAAIEWQFYAAELRKMLATPSVEQRREALFQIRNLRTAEASRIAITALKDSDEMVRATAAGSVIFLPPAEAAPALIPLLTDRSEFVRREAAYALGKSGDPSATVPLVRVLEQDRDLEVRAAAAVGLGGIGDVAAVASLVRYLQTRPREENEFVRRSAARAIGQIAQIQRTGSRTVLTPENFLPDEYKSASSTKLPTSETHPVFRSGIPVLIAVVRSSNEEPDTVREAAFALGAIGDPTARPILEASLRSSDPYLVEIAREALLKIHR